MADACHSHVTLSKIGELHNFITPQRLHLLPLRKTSCIVAEVLKPKERTSSFSEETCRVGCHLALCSFPGT